MPAGQPEAKQNNNKDNMKPNQLILATFAGMQLVFPAWVADDTVTNSRWFIICGVVMLKITSNTKAYQ